MPAIICIDTEFVYPPVPIRNQDWAAWEDGKEEFGPVGRGGTREEAVEDLLERIDEES